ncbi:hypothetical protein GYMLUDRAFT_58473 [Collybiopsis luxurians FD-317 M1]|uniref:DUF6987 domain-containing protein n=1 Tax=Collybiopsis luxurians FD-317 M1 TaxID=944289 RepID=A0A0D0D042_9AGAR|nr:hypothetical protein GYMLUDRAFT_58473 [Collybiopsis luxurians FD-317 M1]
MSQTENPTTMNQHQGGTSKDERTDDQRKQDAQLAERLSGLIEDANSRVVPLCNMIRKHIETASAQDQADQNQDELTNKVKPLLQQAEKILNETHGMIKGADPDNKISSKARSNQKAFQATPEEQRLAEALKVMIEEVGGIIDWARDKIDNLPKAKKDLGPLLDALSQPLTQIVGGVGMLLAGVLNLVGNLLKGIGLDSLFKSIVGAMGLKDILSGLGFGDLFSN